MRSIRPMMASEARLMRTLREQGLSLAEIAARSGRSQQTVGRHVLSLESDGNCQSFRILSMRRAAVRRQRLFDACNRAIAEVAGMSPDDALFDATRRVFTRQLERYFRLCGRASVGIVCEGIVAAVIPFLSKVAGPEAAQAAVARFAILAVEPAPESTPVEPEGE